MTQRASAVLGVSRQTIVKPVSNCDVLSRSQAIRGRYPLSDVIQRIWHHPAWNEGGFPGDPVHGDACLRGAEIRWSRGRQQLLSQG